MFKGTKRKIKVMIDNALSDYYAKQGKELNSKFDECSKCKYVFLKTSLRRGIKWYTSNRYYSLDNSPIDIYRSAHKNYCPTCLPIVQENVKAIQWAKNNPDKAKLYMQRDKKRSK